MRVSAIFLIALGITAAAAVIVNVGNDFDVKRVIPDDTVPGVTFTPAGDLYTYSGNVICKYANAVNLADGATLSRSGADCRGVGAGGIGITSSKNGRLYTTTGYEISATTPFGIIRRAWANCGSQHGIALDPRDGAMFLSNYGARRIYRIPDPDTNPGTYNTDCNDFYFNTGSVNTGFDGITIGPDGTLYGAGYDAHKLVIVSGYSATSTHGNLIAAPTSFTSAPDGISICIGNGESFALVAQTTGTIQRFKLSGPDGAPIYKEDTIATGVGGYLDFSAVDPKGCIWGSALSGGAGFQGFYRVKNRDGSCGCASAQVPIPTPCQDPNSWACISNADLAALQGPI